MRRPEAATQRKIAGFLSKHLPEDAFFTSIAHGARLGDGDEAWLRGVLGRQVQAKSGVPDMLVLWSGRAFWGEVKSMKGSLSAAQKHTIPQIEHAGCPVAVWRSVEDVRASLIAWGIPILDESLSSERIRRGFQAEFRPFEREGIAMKDWPASDQIGQRRRRTP